MLLVLMSVVLVSMGVSAAAAAVAVQVLRRGGKNGRDPQSHQPRAPGHHRHPLSLAKKMAYAGLFFTLTGTLVYGGSVTHRSRKIYKSLKQTRLWRPPAFARDEELGHVPVRNYRGEMRMPIGPGIPTRHDENGFRVPVDQPVPPT